MVIYDKAGQNCRIYEIKHSTEVNEKQTIHLRDAEKCQIVENALARSAVNSFFIAEKIRLPRVFSI
ncbi:MAG: hypothetical protein ACLUS6_13355 [Dysosmobacter sp.]